MQNSPMVCFVDNDHVYYGVIAICLQKNSIDAGRCVDHDFMAIDDMIEDCNPEIVIVSYKSTKPETIDSVKWINIKYPSIKVIITTQFSSKQTIEQCKSVNIFGVIYRSSDDASKLIEAIRLAQKDEKHLPWEKKSD